MTIRMNGPEVEEHMKSFYASLSERDRRRDVHESGGTFLKRSKNSDTGNPTTL